MIVKTEDNKGREVYDRLDTLARVRGTRISAVCDEMGLRRALVSDLKAGRTNTIGATYLSMFAQYFNVTMDYLYNGDKADELVNALSADEQLLVNAWRNCTDEQRENIAFILRDYHVALPKKELRKSSSLKIG